jgi:hypothetical protein
LQEQLFVFADFDNLTALHDHQPIGAAQRAQSMCNRNRRAPLDQSLERLLDLALGFGID